MRTRLPQLRGKALAYVAYAAVMAAAGCGLWATGEREYQARLDQLHLQLSDVAENVSTLVNTSTGHVDLMRRQAEALLEEPAPTFGARRAFAGLAPAESFSGYALDRLPPNSSPDQLVNLTGSGEIPPIQSGAGREMLMGLSLGAVLQATHAQIPDAAWIYYTSANHFIVMAPWVPSRDFHWQEALLGYEFFKGGIPERNPGRAQFWTDLYVDAAGKGLMATVGRPVYDKSNRFRGTINLDLTLGTFDRLLAQTDFGRSRALLVNAQNHVIADSAGLPPERLVDLAEVLPPSPDLDAGELSSHDYDDAFHRHGGWVVYLNPVAGAPWRFLLLVDRYGLILEVLRSLWIGFAGIALLALAIVAVEQRRRASVALAENVATLQRMTLTLASARDEAQQANSAKSMLLANVSHELRTPLNAIIGFSDLMRHQIYGPLGNARYDEYADHIQRSGQLLLSLINDLLDVTKLEAGRHELTESECSLAALAKEAVGLVKMQAERGGVSLTATIDENLPPVFADERALRQIILNLLSNAVKFTPNGGAVRISCALNPAGAPTVVVRDTGRGIPHEEMQNLFQPFARTADAKRASTPGTGLGLAIVKSLVELHQGAIALESRVGFGTTVTVTLPATRIIATAARGAA
ncbi:ATP-binding protein [Dongia sp.]|uniref:sensor histidine kinase n=1 Tax=Dongia sp. TaxID=1977262 RepID=UPI0037520786